MAYTAKSYLDYSGLTRFKNKLETEMEDMVSVAMESVVTDIKYNNNDNHALTLTDSTGTTVITTADTTVTENSNNLVTSGAVYAVIGDVEALLAAI